MPSKGSRVIADIGDFNRANTIVFGAASSVMNLLRYRSMSKRLETMGVYMNGDQWKCGNCNGFTFNGPYGVHRCHTITFTYDEFPDFFNDNGRQPQCKFCNYMATSDKPHHCIRALPFTYVMDASAVDWFDNQEKEDEYKRFFKGMATAPNRIVSVFKDPYGSGNLMRHDLFVGPTTLPLANHMGLFTLSGVKRGSYEGVMIDPLHPKVSHDCIGSYTGKEIGLDEEEHSEHITSQTVTWVDGDGDESSRRIDAKDYGGVVYFANQAHQGFKPLLVMRDVCIDRRYDAYLCVGDDEVAEYDEVFWDYNAITDDKDDALLDVVCVCGCGNKMLKYESAM